MTSLQALPPELLESIGDCLTDAKDWSALRLTCRSIESATRRSWAKTFFSCLDLFISATDCDMGISDLPDFRLLASKIVIHCPDDQTFADPGHYTIESRVQKFVPFFRKLRRAKRFTFISIGNMTDWYNSDGAYVSSGSFCFDMVMLAAQAAGLRPKEISCFTSGCTLDSISGTRHCAGLVFMKECFSELEQFSTDLLLEDGDRATPPNGIELGRHTWEGCNNMRALKKLSLTLGWTIQGQDFFHEFASSVFLPCLERLSFSIPMFHTKFMVDLVHRHRLTLGTLWLNYPNFSELGPPMFHTLLEEVRDNLSLVMLALIDPFSSSGKILFEGVNEITIDADWENEDGYIVIYTNPNIILRTQKDVQDFIPKMLSSITYADEET